MRCTVIMVILYYSTINTVIKCLIESVGYILHFDVIWFTIGKFSAQQVQSKII